MSLVARSREGQEEDSARREEPHVLCLHSQLRRVEANNNNNNNNTKKRVEGDFKLGMGG